MNNFIKNFMKDAMLFHGCWCKNNNRTGNADPVNTSQIYFDG